MDYLNLFFSENFFFGLCPFSGVGVILFLLILVIFSNLNVIISIVTYLGNIGKHKEKSVYNVMTQSNKVNISIYFPPDGHVLSM